MTFRIAALVVGSCILLSGCVASTEGPYGPRTSNELQLSVLAVTDASASDDPVSALARLDELQAQLLDSYAKGTIPQPRFDSIRAAIDLVRADLEDAISTPETVVPNDSPVDPAPVKPGKPDKPDKPDKKN